MQLHLLISLGGISIATFVLSLETPSEILFPALSMLAHAAVEESPKSPLYQSLISVSLGRPETVTVTLLP